MADKKRLRGYVHVVNPETSMFEVFGPDDDLPKWAVEAIDPGAFDDEETAQARKAEAQGRRTVEVAAGGVGNDEYDGYDVKAAIAFLETLPEDQREGYFERERAAKRKGVLKHFEVQ